MAISDKIVTKARLQDYTTGVKGYISTAIADKVDKVEGKGLSTEDFTTALKNKLDGIDMNANKITVDSALSTTSTNPVQNKAINTALSNKVDKVSGKGLSSNDFTADLKSKLEDIDIGANKTIVDSSLNATSTNPVQNGAIYTALDTKVDKVTGKQLSAEDFTSELKSKLEGIATGANKITVDTALSSTSTNPVQNKVINTTLGNKVDKVNGKGLSTNDFTTTLKNKLDGIAEGATAVTVDAALSSSSANPVQNSVIQSALAGKVDKVSGKALSTNDFTTALKNKLDGIDESADVNVIETIKVNNAALTVSSKAVNISVPTMVSSLTNDSGYQTASQVNSAIATAIGNVNHFGFSIVSVLPDKSSANTYTIYLVYKGTSGTGNDVYTEYALINGNWEIIGDTDVDLSGYVKETDLVEITKAEVDAMFA